MDIQELTAQVERVSQRYASRFGIDRDANWFVLKLQEEIGELTQAHLMISGQARTKGRSAEEIQAMFRAEVADVLCQVLILARHHEIDVVEEVRSKWLVFAADAAPLPPPGDGDPSA
jgi:NTP pyrophosphatase (non-canonical NTP hydrolase)